MAAAPYAEVVAQLQTLTLEEGVEVRPLTLVFDAKRAEHEATLACERCGTCPITGALFTTPFSQGVTINLCSQCYGRLDARDKMNFACVAYAGAAPLDMGDWVVWAPSMSTEQYDKLERLASDVHQTAAPTLEELQMYSAVVGWSVEATAAWFISRLSKHV